MKKGRDETVVGMFVIVGFLLLTIVVFFVSGVYVFRKGYTLEVVYQYVSILDKGAPVRMAGVRIGEVSKVDLVFDEDLGQTRVVVKLFIEKGVEIRENYLFYIRGTHILSEPHVEIAPQPGSFPLLQEGTRVDGVDPTPIEALVHRGHRIAEDLEQMIGNLRHALEDEEMARAIKETVLNLATLTDSLNRLMSDSEEDLREARRNINIVLESLSGVLDKIDSGDGTIGKLLAEDELYQEMREFVKEIKEHPWKLLKRDDKRKKILGIV
ncbi:MAG: MlaD family protein [Candidatus Omnitrophota bacterium]|nr:MlaD family protein [Candidatus Omnitrophota bacterium]